MILPAFLALLAAPAAPAVAAPPPAKFEAVDPGTVAEAMRLLDSQDFEEGVMRSSEMALEASLAGMTEQFQKTYGDAIPSDFIDQMRQAMRDHMRKTMFAKLPAMKLEAARLYAREFTSAELIRLRELGADPVMVKARERNKVLSPQLMMIGMRAMHDSQPELDATLKRLVADYLAHKNGKPSS